MGIPATLSEELKIKYSYSIKFEVRYVTGKNQFRSTFFTALNMTGTGQKAVGARKPMGIPGELTQEIRVNYTYSNSI